MVVNVELDLNYRIVSIPEYDKKGKKLNTFSHIHVFFYHRNTMLTDSIVSKYDVKEKVPYMESLNIDFYHLLTMNISLQLVNKLNEMWGVDINRADFMTENKDFFYKFLEEFKKTVNETFLTDGD